MSRRARDTPGGEPHQWCGERLPIAPGECRKRHRSSPFEPEVSPHYCNLKQRVMERMSGHDALMARSHAPAWECRCGRSSGQGFMTLERLDLFPRWSVGARGESRESSRMDSRRFAVFSFVIPTHYGKRLTVRSRVIASSQRAGIPSIEDIRLRLPGQYLLADDLFPTVLDLFRLQD